MKWNSSRGHRKVNHGGEDSKTLTAKSHNKTAGTSLFWARFWRLLLFETGARVLRRSQVHNKRPRGGSANNNTGWREEAVRFRKFFHVHPKALMLARGVTVESAVINIFICCNIKEAVVLSRTHLWIKDYV